MNLVSWTAPFISQPSLLELPSAGWLRYLFENGLDRPEAAAAKQSDPFRTAMQVVSGVAIIWVGGPIGQKLDNFAKYFGAVDVADITADLDQAEADPQVRGILLYVDSPGGMVAGTPELSDRILARTKTIYTFSDGLVASAAFWIAAATDGIFTTQTANVGSIGVYVPHFDQTQRYANAGVKVELIKSGELKGVGFPGTPLSPAGRDHLQERVDQIATMFKTHVHARRPGITAANMEGQTFLAPAAVKLGLIDAIVTNLQEAAALI